MSAHHISVCSCGTVIAQCRCPSPNKEKRVVPNGCKACRGAGGGANVFDIPVYKGEAGLEQVIRSSGRVSYASLANLAEPVSLSDADKARLRALAVDLARADINDSDLHHLSTILVSVGWNKNDDVFDPVETWVARHSPSHKQLNYEHDDSKIVGHITANHVIDAAGGTVADETCTDALPAKFHIVSAGVLYKHWQTPELQKRMDTLIAEIAQGKWFVSMECLFKGFDYCLKDASGGARVVARNEKTAFLSKHLRAYGGSGQYGEYRVGRVLRNIVFSGKGLVRNPANPESVILTSDSEPVATSGQALAEFPGPETEQVYSPATNSGPDLHKESQDVMTITAEQYQAVQAELAGAKAELEKLKTSQSETALAEAKTKLEAALVGKAEADALLLKANEALAAANTGSATATQEATARIEALTKELDEARAALAQINAEKTKLSRLATAKDKLKLDETAAAAFVEGTKSQSDEAFAAQVDVMVAAMSAWAAQTPPKATDKPTAPKATSKPTAPKATAGVETDEAGEDAADETDLSAKAGNDAALSTTVTDSGVTDVQTAIAKCFGITDDAA